MQIMANPEGAAVTMGEGEGKPSGKLAELERRIEFLEGFVDALLRAVGEETLTAREQATEG